MIIEAGAGRDAVILNADRIVTVKPQERSCLVTFTNGAREAYAVTMADFLDVPGFHTVREAGGGRMLVNLKHVDAAKAVGPQDRTMLHLNCTPSYGPGGGSRPFVVVELSLAAFAELVRGDDAPAPRM